MMKGDQVNLVADIGGTNIRIAQTNAANELSHIQTFVCREFEGLQHVLAKYIDDQNLSSHSIHACLAIACPTEDDWVSMTNLPWQFSQAELKANLGLSELMFINDYTAIAMAIPYLSDDQKVKIGSGGDVKPNQVMSVCGPGTGLGVATLVPATVQDKTQWLCVNSEGGHVDFAPIDDVDLHIFTYLRSKMARVSYEQLLSGYGLEQIYQALRENSENKSELPETLQASEISANAVNETCSVCYQSLAQFCKVLGSFAGNLALLNKSFGGVYIAGGIAPRFIEFIQASGFRQRFEDKGRLAAIPKQIATYIITESQPGLLGAAVYLNQQNG